MNKVNKSIEDDIVQNLFAIKNQFLANTVQGINIPDDNECEFNQTWLCTL